MQINAAGLAIIKAFEGCLKKLPDGRFTTYQCPANVTTIGYGHTNLGGVPPHITRGDIWTQADCDSALAADMGKFERHVSRLGPEIKDPNQFAAIVSWSFNCGGPASSSVWKYARAGDKAETRVRLLRWNKAGGRVLNGLVRRRESEADLFDGNVSEALRTAGVARGALPMPQRADVPKPPPSAVAKVVRKEAAGATATGGTSATVAAKEPAGSIGMKLLEWTAIGLCAGISLILIVLAVKRGREFIRDWA
jgi:lysozyme